MRPRSLQRPIPRCYSAGASPQGPSPRTPSAPALPGSAARPASADLDPVRRPPPPRPGRLGWTRARGPGLSSTLGSGGGGGLGRDQRGQSKRLGSRPSRQDGVSSQEGPPPLTPRPGKRCAGARRSSDSPSSAAATAPAERGRKTKPQAASRALCLRRCKRDPASGFSSLAGRPIHSFIKRTHACINARPERTRSDAPSESSNHQLRRTNLHPVRASLTYPRVPRELLLPLPSFTHTCHSQIRTHTAKSPRTPSPTLNSEIRSVGPAAPSPLLQAQVLIS